MLNPQDVFSAGSVEDVQSPLGQLEAGAPQPDPGAEDVLYQALLKRKRRNIAIELSIEDREKLVDRIINDFETAASNNKTYREDRVQYLRNWMMTPEELPDGAGPIGEQSANIKVPMTSTYIEQWKARLSKALLGGEVIAKFESLSNSFERDKLIELTTWFQWELEHVVKLEESLEDILHYALVDGICLPIPTYEREVKQLSSTYEFDLVEGTSLKLLLEAKLKEIFVDDEYDALAVEEVDEGVYEVPLDNFDRPARVRFLIDEGELVAEVERPELIFDGVRIHIPNIEDVYHPNNNSEIEKLTFIGFRLWLLAAKLREMCGKNKAFKIVSKEDIDAILATSGPKIDDVGGREVSNEMDDAEGLRSDDAETAVSRDEENAHVKVYRWEGVISYKGQRRDVVVYVAATARKLLGVEALEELNKEGKRSPVKFGFIKVPGRFLTMGMGQWLRHSQEEIDSVHNFRLNAGLIANIPFGFYVPAAGQPKDILQLEAGKLYPAKSKDSVWFPNIPYSPVWGFNEEALTRKYASEHAAIGDIGVGSFTSKRTSAAEFVGTAASLDIRTEMIVKGFVRSLKELLYRTYGLYQQHAKGRRVYQVGSLDSYRTTKFLEHDRMSGRMILNLTASLQQLSPQLERDTSSLMLQLLMNQLLLSMGIVKQDTIYEAMKRVARSYGAATLPLHMPDQEPDSPPPNVEHEMLQRGEPIEPHSGENFGLHIASHSRLLSDPKVAELIPNPLVREALAQHLKQTIELRDQVAIIRQQQQLMALQMQKSMNSLGIRGGAGQQTAGSQAEPSSREEGNALAETETGEA